MNPSRSKRGWDSNHERKREIGECGIVVGEEEGSAKVVMDVELRRERETHRERVCVIDLVCSQAHFFSAESRLRLHNTNLSFRIDRRR